MADNGENGSGTGGEGGNGQPDPQGGSGGSGNGNQGGSGGNQGSSGSAGNGNQGGNGASGESDTEALRKQIAELEADRDKWKKNSRQHEDRAKANAEDAKAKQTVEEQLAELRKDIAKRDADAVSERGDQAVEKLQAKLVRGGLSDEDATTLVGNIDPMRLLADDGRPDTGEIDKLAKSLVKIGTRPTADRDQGRRGGGAPPSMNDLIRGAAQRNTVTS